MSSTKDSSEKDKPSGCPLAWDDNSKWNVENKHEYEKGGKWRF